MGLFGGKNHNIYKDTHKHSRGSTPPPKWDDCGTCHGTGFKLVKRSGRPDERKRCGSCGGRGKKKR